MDLNLSALTRPLERLMATAQNGFEVAALGRSGDRGGALAVPDRREHRRCTSSGATSRRTTGPASPPAGPPVLMVHPMMMSANMWDVTQEDGAVGILHAAGVDPWVIDFGSPDEVEGGMERTLTDHIVALERGHRHRQGDHRPGRPPRRLLPGRHVLLPDRRLPPSQGRRQHHRVRLAGGHPGRPAGGLPDQLRRGRWPTSWPTTCSTGSTSRAGWPAPVSRCSTRSRPPSPGSTSCCQLHDREALLPREQQRRFLDSEGWIAWSGPAVAELLKQFVAHNRMMTGGFAIQGQLVTLSDITCPVLAFVGEVDDIGQPPVGARHQAGRAERRRLRGDDPGRALRPGRRIQGRHHHLADGGRLGAVGVGRRPAPGATSRRCRTPTAEPADSGVALSSRIMHGVAEASELAAVAGAKGAADAVVAANKSMRTLAVETARTLPRLVRLGQINDHTRISLGRIIDEQAERRPTASSCSSTAGCTPTRRSTAASTTWCAA